jgi:hypothetical protein
VTDILKAAAAAMLSAVGTLAVIAIGARALIGALFADISTSKAADIVTGILFAFVAGALIVIGLAWLARATVAGRPARDAALTQDQVRMIVEGTARYVTAGAHQAPAQLAAPYSVTRPRVSVPVIHDWRDGLSDAQADADDTDADAGTQGDAAHGDANTQRFDARDMGAGAGMGGGDFGGGMIGGGDELAPPRAVGTPAPMLSTVVTDANGQRVELQARADDVVTFCAVMWPAPTRRVWTGDAARYGRTASFLCEHGMLRRDGAGYTWQEHMTQARAMRWAHMLAPGIEARARTRM